MISKTMGTVEWLLLVTLSVLWGGSFFFNAVILDDLPPLTVVFARVGIAAVALWLVITRAIVMGGHWPVPGPPLWLAFLAMGALNNVIPFTLIVWGQTHIGSGLASILNATTPLFTVILAHWLTHDERMTTARVMGVVCGLMGVVVMIGTSAVAELGIDVLAQLAVIGAAISYALAGIFGRRFTSTPPLVTAAGQLGASAIMMLPLVLFVDTPWRLAALAPETWAAMLGLALLSTALAYIIYFRILARAGATNILLVTLLVPVSAVLLATFVLGEALQVRQLAGMGLIALGLAAIDGRLMAAVRAAMGRLKLHAR